MKNLIKISVIFIVLHSGFVRGQTKFITGGTILFEKTQNMFAILKKKVTKDNMENKARYEDYQRTEEQFLKYKSTLIFNASSSLFTPMSGKAIPWYYDAPIADQINIVFSDFSKGTTTVQKDFYERRFLIKDSLRKITWKLTDETRNIAGYNCRRANGLVLDSVYVVAFYAEDIHVSGGPESFNGLPGMMLQVVLPHENVSWIATDVNLTPVDDKKLTPPTNGTPINYKKLYDILWEAQGKYGEMGRYFIKGFYL
jgi:GLPGLI family protein